MLFRRYNVLHGLRDNHRIGILIEPQQLNADDSKINNRFIKSLKNKSIIKNLNMSKFNILRLLSWKVSINFVLIY